MSTNVAIIGKSIAISKNRDIAYEYYKDLGFNPIDQESFCIDWGANIGSWIPYRDLKGVYGFIRIDYYEYDAFEIEAYNYSEGCDQGEHIPMDGEVYNFAILYYNGADCPLKFQGPILN